MDKRRTPRIDGHLDQASAGPRMHYTPSAGGGALGRVSLLESGPRSIRRVPAASKLRG